MIIDIKTDNNELNDLFNSIVNIKNNFKEQLSDLLNSPTSLIKSGPDDNNKSDDIKLLKDNITSAINEVNKLIYDNFLNIIDKKLDNKIQAIKNELKITDENNNNRKYVRGLQLQLYHLYETRHTLLTEKRTDYINFSADDKLDLYCLIKNATNFTKNIVESNFLKYNRFLDRIINKMEKFLEKINKSLINIGGFELKVLSISTDIKDRMKPKSISEEDKKEITNDFKLLHDRIDWLNCKLTVEKELDNDEAYELSDCIKIIEDYSQDFLRICDDNMKNTIQNYLNDVKKIKNNIKTNYPNLLKLR